MRVLLIALLLSLTAVTLGAQSNPLASRDTVLGDTTEIFAAVPTDVEVIVSYVAADTIDALPVFLGSSSVAATTGMPLTVGTQTVPIFLTRGTGLWAITGAAGDTVVVRILKMNKPGWPSAY